MRRRIVALVLALCLAGRSGGAWAAEQLSPYVSCEEVLAEVRGVAAAHPARVALEEIGRTVVGRPILALHFHGGAGANAEALITAGIHAQEFIGVEVALAAARLLAQGAADDFLRRSSVWVVPLVNVDGYCRIYEAGGRSDQLTKGRKNLHGVDLNRNFPLAPGAKSRHPLAGSRRPGSRYYMGPQALSEPESRAIAELAAAHDFYAAINLHSVAGKYLYPFCYTRAPAPEAELFRQIGQAMTERQPHYRYQVQQSYSWYPTLGDLDDFLYIQHGVLSATVEVGAVRRNLPAFLKTFKFFWMANPKQVSRWTGNDATALLAALQKALDLTAGRPLTPGARPGQSESPAIIYPRLPVP